MSSIQFRLGRIEFNHMYVYQHWKSTVARLKVLERLVSLFNVLCKLTDTSFHQGLSNRII